ncbi:MAG: hypothetical protein EPO07_05635 [Verrucomicrobia bacterium]|nr:MAG: hypothetical protein EPO07_05635 [Verrucomicrobiota bacterium]
MRLKPADLNRWSAWEELDFRNGAAKECRIACHWEHSRQINKPTRPNISSQSSSPETRPACNGHPLTRSERIATLGVRAGL